VGDGVEGAGRWGGGGPGVGGRRRRVPFAQAIVRAIMVLTLILGTSGGIGKGEDGQRDGRGWCWRDALLVKPREPAAFGMRQGTTRRGAPRSSRAADSRVALTSTPMKLLSMGWSLAFMWAACARAPSAVRGKL
jgi:hypothetical protein